MKHGGYESFRDIKEKNITKVASNKMVVSIFNLDYKFNSSWLMIVV